MSPARTVFAALALTAFLACESVLEPEVSVDVSSLAFSHAPAAGFSYAFGEVAGAPTSA